MQELREFVQENVVENDDVLPQIKIEEKDVKDMSMQDLREIIKEAVEESIEETEKVDITNIEPEDIMKMSMGDLRELIKGTVEEAVDNEIEEVEIIEDMSKPELE